MLVITSVACAVLSVGGLAASYLVKSPQQAAADSAPPAASVITATVQKRVLETTLITRGTVTAGRTIEATPVVPDVGAQILTAARVKAGDQLKPGTVLLAVSGRPLFALAGSLPSYRDLLPGAKGPDVAQAQKALRQLGYSTRGDRSGYFGAGTKRAVGNMYLDAGYEPPTTGGAQAATLRAAAADVAASRTGLARLQRRIQAGDSAAGGEEPLPRQLAAMRTTLAEAERAHQAVVARTGAMLPLSEVVFVPRFPARVVAVSAQVGDVVKAPLVKIATGRLTVRVFMPVEQSEQFDVGMPASVASEVLGKEADGKISGMGEATTDTDQKPDRPPPGTPYRAVTVTPAKELPPDWADEDVRVTIKAARTDTATLVVPVSAVSASADGTSTVSVVAGEGTTRRVEVEAGASGDGFVAVTPLNGSLAQGDRVVIGMPS